MYEQDNLETPKSKRAEKGEGLTPELFTVAIELRKLEGNQLN